MPKVKALRPDNIGYTYMMMHKIITILEAKVEDKKWDALQQAYRGIERKSGQPWPVLSYLLQMKDNPRLWRIVTVWESIEVLQKVRSSGETPPGILVFRAAGAEPTLSIFEAKEEL